MRENVGYGQLAVARDDDRPWTIDDNDLQRVVCRLSPVVLQRGLVSAWLRYVCSLADTVL